jgi:hypothetical protein
VCVEKCGGGGWEVGVVKEEGEGGRGKGMWKVENTKSKTKRFLDVLYHR